MKKKLSEWMNKARNLEAAIGARVEGASQAMSTSARQPLEIVHAIVDGVGSEAQPSGRGKQTFPYTHIRVTLRAATSKDKAKMEVACEGPPSLEDRIHERLAAAGCSSAPPAVKITFAQASKPEWTNADFHLDFTRGVPAPPPPQPVAHCRLELSVTQGITDAPTYAFTEGVVAIGRGAEVRDRNGRLLRTNHVVFEEGGGDVNSSVSRRHARIECESPAGAFRLHDDAGGERTTVVRDGRGLRVPHGRGLRLKSGDVIAVGDARITVTIG